MSGSTVRETLGFISVVAGLVFVGVEIHQNTAIARAATRQALSASSSEFVLVAATNDELGRQIDKWLFGEEGHTEACPDDLHQACRWIRAQLRLQENVFLQFREGLIDESVFYSYGWRDNATFESPYFAPWWRAIRTTYHPDFVAAFEAEYGLAP